jgi:hypothetical protein
MLDRLINRDSLDAAPIRWLVFVTMLTAGVEISAQPVEQDTSSSDQVVVLTLTDQATKETMERLVRSVSAHLNTLPARVETEHTKTLPRTEMEQVEFARNRGRSANASFVLWLSAADRLAIFSPVLDDAFWSVAGLDEPVGSVGWCESIAVMVHSNVAALLPAPAIQAEHERDTPLPDPTPETESATDTRQLTSSFTPDVQKKSTPIWLNGSVGYSPTWPLSDTTAMHGVQIAVGIGVGDHLGIEFQGDIKKPLRLETDDGSIEWVDWPLKLLMSGFLSLGRFRLGGSVGGLMTISYLRGWDRDPIHEPTADTRINIGMRAAASLRYWMYQWLGIALEGGVDILADRIQFTLAGETVADVRRIRPSFSVGIALRYSLVGG